MSISSALLTRSQGLCELCGKEEAQYAYWVQPSENKEENQVVVGVACFQALENGEDSFRWRCLESSIWSTEACVQALSYRILHTYQQESWASDILSNVFVTEDIEHWALSGLEAVQQHIDAFGNVLEQGDTVVLTQALDVKGTNFTAPKGTVVKRIKLVADDATQIEGKINDQTIVILTKYVKKG